MVNRIFGILVCIIFSNSLYVNAQDFQTKCNTYLIGKGFEIEEFVHSIAIQTFGEPTPVYCSPDIRSKVRTTIPFNTALNSASLITRHQLDSVQHYLGDKRWYSYTFKRTKWWQVNYNGIVGYVADWDVCEKQEQFDFLINEMNWDNGRIVSLKLPATEKQFVLDEVQFEYMHGYRIYPIKNSALPINSGNLYCFETYRESCPGATEYSIFHVDDFGFTKMISAFSTGEAGTFDEEIIYFPFRTKKGICLLNFERVARNEFSLEENDEKDRYSFPKNLGIPIQNCVIKTHHYTEYSSEEDGGDIEHETGEYTIEIIKNQPIIYTWNNEQLEELGSVYFLDRIDQLSQEIKMLKKKQQ